MRQQRRFLTLDGMRGIAAFIVLVRHMGGAPAAVFSGGYLAVDFFFCLSGFVLAHAYGEGSLTLPQFMRVRVIRLYPLYFVGMVLGIVAAVLIGATALQILGATAFGAAFAPTPFTIKEAGETGSLYPLDAPAWSLFFELVANFAWFPLRRFLAGRAAIIPIAICAVVCVACDLRFGAAAGPTWSHMIGGFGRAAFSFPAGVLTYEVWRRSKWRPAFPSWLIGLGLIAVLAAPVDRAWFDPFAVLVLMAPLVFLGACCKPSTGASAQAERLLGDASYPVYVLQMPIIIILDQMVGPLRASHLPFVSSHPSLVTTPLTFVLVVVGALWLDRVYDRPIRRWLTTATAFTRAKMMRAAE